MARYARNTWIADTIHWWAFCSLNASPGARAYYDELVRHEAPHDRAEVKDLRRWPVAAG
jgi:hypothetical protein